MKCPKLKFRVESDISFEVQSGVSPNKICWQDIINKNFKILTKNENFKSTLSKFKHQKTIFNANLKIR